MKQSADGFSLSINSDDHKGLSGFYGCYPGGCGPGCDNCLPLHGKLSMYYRQGRDWARRVCRKVNGSLTWTGKIHFNPEAMASKMCSMPPSQFIASYMGDISLATPEQLEIILGLMKKHEKHIYVLLTRKPAKLGKILSQVISSPADLGHVGLATSIEMGKYWWRLKQLKEVAKQLRWEGHLELWASPIVADVGTSPSLEGIETVHISNERSGRASAGRPFKHEWTEGLLDRCQADGIRTTISWEIAPVKIPEALLRIPTVPVPNDRRLLGRRPMFAGSRLRYGANRILHYHGLHWCAGLEPGLGHAAPKDDFYSRNCASGLAGRCKRCTSLYQTARYRRKYG